MRCRECGSLMWPWQKQTSVVVSVSDEDVYRVVAHQWHFPGQALIAGLALYDALALTS